jgi:hypothetical protein
MGLRCVHEKRSRTNNLLYRDWGSSSSHTARVRSVALCNRRRSVDFRYVATRLARRCNMSQWANCRLMHRSKNMSPCRHGQGRFTRAAQLSEGPQSAASRLIARPERSMQILKRRDRSQADAPPPHALRRHVRDGRKRMRDSGKVPEKRGSDVGLSSPRRWPRQNDQAQ